MTQTANPTAEKVTGYGVSVGQIVGYTFAAETYCPTHAIFALPTGPGDAFNGWALAADAVVMCPEDNLDEIAWALGIERAQEDTYDCEDFPKVILAQDVTSPGDAEALPELGGATCCATCHEPLVG